MRKVAACMCKELHKVGSRIVLAKWRHSRVWFWFYEWSARYATSHAYAQCPGSVIEPRLNSFLHNFNNEPMTYWSQSVYKWPWWSPSGQSGCFQVTKIFQGSPLWILYCEIGKNWWKSYFWIYNLKASYHFVPKTDKTYMSLGPQWTPRFFIWPSAAVSTILFLSWK